MEKNSNSKRNKSKFYFIVGYLFLLVMALFWAVDAALVYIFFGLGVFFLFFGFYVRPQKDFENPFGSEGGQSSGSTSTFSDIFKERGRYQKSPARNPASQSTVTPSNPQTNRRVAVLAVLAIFATFIIFFVGSIVSSSTDVDDATFYFQTAEENYWNERYDSAYMNYRRAMLLNDEYPEAMVGYGNVLSVRDQLDSAIIMYDKALEINPDYKEASYNKALMFYNRARYNESIEVLKPVLQSNPDYYDAMLLTGDNYYSQKQYDDALPWYEKAYDEGGIRSRNLCHIMAYLYDTKGNYAKAIDLYKEALSYDSTVVDIYKRLGELLPNDDGSYYRTQAVRLQQP